MSGYDKMPFGGKVITLAGPASQELDLGGVAQVILAWEPKDKSAHEIEVRARIVNITDPDSEGDPEVEWSMEVGHGSDVWREPSLSKTSQALKMKNFTLPGRGMIWRIASRWFRIGFANVGAFATSEAKSIVQVSFLPVWGEHSGVRPYIYRAAISVANEQHPFPIAAREFRIQNPNSGLPFVAAVTDILFIGVTGNFLDTVDVTNYGDFHPIPHAAAGFRIISAAVDVAYR